ncbi:MAG: hypothetical protein KatS3mg101_1155 [Patescibacteria group bacterium]|nr:MAG: hypothetical protein KatS3mg101_1155 [Patescibacteria group bacterium]
MKKFLIISIFAAVLMVGILVYLKNKKKSKLLLDVENVNPLTGTVESTGTGTGTSSGVADTYDPGADVMRILNAKGFWNDDEEAVYDTLKRLGTKERLRKLREAFIQQTGKTLESFLADFMNDEELAKVSSIINSLK